TPKTTSDQAHSRLISAITAPQTPRWRPPAPGDYAAQALTGTRRAALLGTCARAAPLGAIRPRGKHLFLSQWTDVDTQPASGEHPPPVFCLEWFTLCVSGTPWRNTHVARWSCLEEADLQHNARSLTCSLGWHTLCHCRPRRDSQICRRNNMEK